MTRRRLKSKAEAARFLGCSTRTLDRWAERGVGPAYYNLPRGREYDDDDLEAWLAARRVEPVPSGPWRPEIRAS